MGVDDCGSELTGPISSGDIWAGATAPPDGSGALLIKGEDASKGSSVPFSDRSQTTSNDTLENLCGVALPFGPALSFRACSRRVL